MKKTLTIAQIKEGLKKVRSFSLILLALFSFQLAGAAEGSRLLQDEKRTINGTVTDAVTNEALPGVSVNIKGTSTGTITDLDGNYTIVAGNTDILVFNFMGYLVEEVTVGTQSNIIVSLSPDIIGLDEVVVVGYGVQQKKLTTGATVQVKNEEFTRNNSTRLESSLQGLTPGMVIVKQSGQPGSDYNINIRGLGSVNGSSPLVLIDGVPGNINSVNPNDVETVDVLKDAASAAIYGSRAADGVILITTKKGKAGEATVTYDFHYGISNPNKLVDVLGAKEFAMAQNEVAVNNKPTAIGPFTQEQIDAFGEGSNWQKEVLNENAPSQSHYFGINGGNEKSNYSMSLSYDNEEGIFNYEGKSNYERIGFRINSEHKVKNYLTIGENVTYSHRNTHGLGVTNIYNNFMRDLIQTDPTMLAYDDSYSDGFGRSTFNPIDIANPLGVMHYNYNEKKHYDDLVGDIYAEIQITKGLKFKSDFGAALSMQNNTTANDSFSLSGQSYRKIPNFNQYMSRNFSYNWDNYLSYSKVFGKHDVQLLIGTNSIDNNKFNLGATMHGYKSNPNLEPLLSNIVSLQPTIDGDTVTISGDYGKTDSRFSVFSRINYNYDQKFLAMVSLRRDGSSRFGSNYRYGLFPAFSAGYVITRENFMDPVSWLDFFKFRFSYGKNGKEPYIPGAFLATVGPYQRAYSFGNGNYIGYSPDKIPNPDLRWESSNQMNFGFDSRFLKNFSINFDWYKKTSSDWIIPQTVAGIVGGDGISTERPLVNGGNVTNSGIELQLGYQKVISDLSINVQANLSYNKNEVTNVPGDIIHGANSVLFNGAEEFYRVEEGYPIGYFRGFKTDGLFQTQAEIDNYVDSAGKKIQNKAKPGDVKRLDLNGDGKLDDKDKTMIGDPNPDFLYGLNISLGYKGFDFSMNISGVAGNQIVQSYRSEDRAYFNYTQEIYDGAWRWEDANNDGIVDAGEGTSTTIPRLTGGQDNNSNWRNFSDIYIHDAGFLRIKSINLGYDFKKLFNKLPVGQFRVYASATNLLTITNYNGLDPEVGYGSSYNSQGILTDAYASGIDLGFYPTPRTYLVGVNVIF